MDKKTLLTKILHTRFQDENLLALTPASDVQESELPGIVWYNASYCGILISMLTELVFIPLSQMYLRWIFLYCSVNLEILNNKPPVYSYEIKQY